MANKQDDPTRTLGIRTKWQAENTRRFRALKGDINRFILKDESIVINESIVTNKTFDFASDPQSVAEFMVWLQGRIDARIFDNKDTAQDVWQNKYINRSYQRGVRVAKMELRKQAVPLGMILEDIQPAPIAFGTATPALGIGPVIGLTAPIHLDAIQRLYQRDFAKLKGITAEMSGEISRVLVESIEQGLGAREIAKNINDRVDKIGLSRSKLLARTETPRAYNIATVMEGEDVKRRTGIGIKYEWLTVGDEKVRHAHALRNRVIYTKRRALELIGEPNCRCALAPFLPETDSAMDKKRRSKQRAKGIKTAA
ncbi:MAG: hypothetical protein KAJ19_10460 [Gammaproteobacteria bacterium]|nr:hypothetical protein [Gammaproteobacteria bacterium]